jgi:hypothetical protein
MAIERMEAIVEARGPSRELICGKTFLRINWSWPLIGSFDWRFGSVASIGCFDALS